MNFLNSAVYSRLGTATALTSLLANGSASIFALQAPEGETLPYVVFNVQGGGDENLSPHRTKNLVEFVRAYSDNSNAEAGSIDAQIDAALHLVPFTGVSGWTNYWLAREQDVETVTNKPTGEPVWMNGGIYRVRFGA